MLHVNSSHNEIRTHAHTERDMNTFTHTGNGDHGNSQNQQAAENSHVSRIVALRVFITPILPLQVTFVWFLYDKDNTPNSLLLQAAIFFKCLLWSLATQNFYSTRCRRGVVDRGTGPGGEMADNSLTPIDNLSSSSIWPLVMLVTPISAERENCTRTADVKLMTLPEV